MAVAARDRRHRLPALATLLVLGACAAPGGPAGVGAPKEPGAPAGTARAVVDAFANICASLDRSAVTRQAARYGFGTLRQEALPAEARAQLAPGSVVFARPVPGSPMVFWTEQPRCELVASGLAPAEVEAEFARFVTALGASGRLAVSTASPEQIAAIPAVGQTRVRQAALAFPREMVPDAQRAFVLSVAAEGPRGPVVSLATQRVDLTPGQPGQQRKD